MADMTPPDLDALLDTFYKTQQYADMGDEERKPPRQVIADAARAAIVAEFTSLRERVAEERAERVLRGKMLVRLRNRLIIIRDGLDDEGDRVYFGSTNDADDFKAHVEELDAFKWDLILSEGAEPDPLEQLQKLREQLESEKIVGAFVRQNMDEAVARAEKAEAALAACRDELAVHRERAANLNNMWRHEFAQKVEAAADEVFARMAWPHKEIRALKTKEPTNG